MTYLFTIIITILIKAHIILLIFHADTPHDPIN